MNPEALPFQPIPAPDEFLANQGFLRRLARELIRDAARAEDLLQDTWLTWRERRPAGLAEPRAWLARVLQNRARNLLRQDQRRAQREQRVARPEAIPSELTQATVDVQAEVVAVLQRLDEPEQTALMLRYYHGLGPTEIAARTGVSLNTVKSRLARALAHLRAELDRRHAHDHKDWRHCLVPLALPEGGSELAPARRDGQPVGPRGGGDGLRGPLGLALAGGLCAVAVVIVVAVLVAQGWSRPERPSVALREAGEGTLAPLAAQLLALPASAEPAVGRVAVQPEPLVVPRNPVEWPQFARNAAHDGFDPKLADRIRTPEVLWHVSDTHGQPTLSGQDLYSGGRGLFWIDPNNGTVLARVLQGAPEAHPEKPDEKIVPLSVAHSPAITPDLVLARRTQDGGVSAYDRTLAREVWSWTPESKGYVHFSGCLAGERFIVATIDEVVALNVADGKPAWTFPTAGHGAVNMVPASAQGRVLFGAEDGTFWCLDLVEGHE
ncbi:MAG TPA: sigma-70 family RNA polymerase sigma factor, partial [Planctomycetota bacterium]